MTENTTLCSILELKELVWTFSVANWCCGAELERSAVKHSIYVLMDYEPKWSALCGALYHSTKKPNYR